MHISIILIQSFLHFPQEEENINEICMCCVLSQGLETFKHCSLQWTKDVHCIKCVLLFCLAKKEERILNALGCKLPPILRDSRWQKKTFLLMVSFNLQGNTLDFLQGSCLGQKHGKRVLGIPQYSIYLIKVLLTDHSLWHKSTLLAILSNQRYRTITHITNVYSVAAIHFS